ncbi:hypothetical protein BD413DRAFT_494456 [Trametes elegans]|nr:hypothetical protein BD413DRAFT_494456 [Trametes elegans]
MCSRHEFGAALGNIYPAAITSTRVGKYGTVVTEFVDHNSPRWHTKTTKIQLVMKVIQSNSGPIRRPYQYYLLTISLTGLLNWACVLGMGHVWDDRAADAANGAFHQPQSPRKSRIDNQEFLWQPERVDRVRKSAM